MDLWDIAAGNLLAAFPILVILMGVREKRSGYGYGTMVAGSGMMAAIVLYALYK